VKGILRQVSTAQQIGFGFSAGRKTFSWGHGHNNRKAKAPSFTLF